jgi:hypothetical protein
MNESAHLPEWFVINYMTNFQPKVGVFPLGGRQLARGRSGVRASSLPTLGEILGRTIRHIIDDKGGVL